MLFWTRLGFADQLIYAASLAGSFSGVVAATLCPDPELEIAGNP